MRRHTILDLDLDVIAQAAAALGTHGTGETVRAALDEVVRAHRRERMLALTTDLGLDDLATMRRTLLPDAQRGSSPSTTTPTTTGSPRSPGSLRAGSPPRSLGR